jgi:hypothetical protein
MIRNQPDPDRRKWEPDRRGPPGLQPETGYLCQFWPFWTLSGPANCLRQRGPCGKNRPPVAPFWADSLEYRACCRSSVVEHSIGNGEVDSSILSGSTIHLLDLYTFILIDLDWPSNTELNWNHHVTTRSSFAVLPGLSHP